jgi:hypothetical protein
MALDYKTSYARYGKFSGLSQEYFDGSNVKKGYSTVASQQNPNPVYTYRPKTAKKGGGFTYGDAVNVYKADQPVAAAAAPAASAAASAPAPLMPTISDASKKYRAETEKLLKEAQEARDQFKAEQEAAAKAKAIAAANQARSGQTASLQIQPASSTLTTAGTQPFKRRKDQFKINTPAYSGLSISQSGMVNV